MKLLFQVDSQSRGNVAGIDRLIVNTIKFTVVLQIYGLNCVNESRVLSIGLAL